MLVIAMVSAVMTMRFAIHGHEVAVPDLVGKTPAEGQKLAEVAGLQMAIERRYYSPSVPEGRVLSQLPLAGAKVRRGWEVRVAESLGPQRVEIPSVLGQSEHAAEITIRRRGLDLGSMAQIQIPGRQGDQVVSQSPPPNASGVSAPKISLLVTTYAQPQALVMPNFAGQPLGSVTQTVQDAGLKVGSITMTPAGTGNPGAGSIIVSQAPAPGEKVAVGAAVDFQVR